MANGKGPLKSDAKKPTIYKSSSSFIGGGKGDFHLSSAQATAIKKRVMLENSPDLPINIPKSTKSRYEVPTYKRNRK